MLSLNYLLDSFVVAVALSIDAMVVSFSQGLIFKKNKRKNSVILAFFVGFFQFIMPLVGYTLAGFVRSYIENFAGIIAFLIFMFLGAKIIFDAVRKNENSQKESCKVAENSWFSLKFLILVSIATSIDALGAGISFNLLKKPIFVGATLIGIITFLNSLIGFWSGQCLKKINSKILEIFAGFILILLAIKVLIENI